MMVKGNLDFLVSADSVGDFRSVPLLHLPEALPPAQHLAQKINDFVLQQLPPLPPPLSPTAPLGHVLVTPSGLGLAHVSREGHACKQLLGDACTLREGMPACDLGAALTGHAVWIFPGHTDAPLSGQRTLAWTKEGRLEAIDPDAVVDAVRPHARGTLRCVVLNGCDSLGLGLQLVDAGVRSVICFETRAHDEAALWFGVGFARAIAQGHDPRAAFEAARAVVRAITAPDSSGSGFVPKFALVSPAAGAVDERGRLGPEAGEAAGRIAAGVPVLLCRPALVAGVPSIDAAHHISRPEDVSEVLRLLSGGSRTALVTSSQSNQVGLPGMPGLGKTRLAACIARDPRLHGMCPDGAVMHSVGEEASAEDAIAALTRTLAAGLKLPEFIDASIAAWQERLQRLLCGKRMLVVIDDAWGDRQVYPIVNAVRGSEGGSLVLATSRRRDVLGNLGASLHQLGLLPEEESLTLMGSWAQPSWTAEQLRADEDAMAVARLCGVGRAGGLPLALSSAGALVRSGRTWGAVLRRLTDARKEVEVGPDYHPEYGEEYRTVETVLRMSIEALPDVEKERYMQLAVFAEDQAIGEEVLMVLWQLESVDEVRDTLALFHERSLFADLNERMLSLSQTGIL